MRTVRDVMSRPVISVEPSTPVREVARLLIDRRISGLPVVDGSGGVIGVVSEADLLVKEAGAGSIQHRPLARLFGESHETQQALARVEARTAGQAMSSPAVTIDADEPVHAAAAVMAERGIKRLPVTEDGRLVGVVTRADVVRAFLASDDELAESVRRDALRGALWVDPDDFDVSVDGGVVRITGKVGRRSTAEMLPRFVRMIPGVVAVEAQIEWELDDAGFDAPGRDLVSPY